MHTHSSEAALDFRTRTWKPKSVFQQWRGLCMAMFAVGAMGLSSTTAEAAPIRTIEVEGQALVEVNPDVVDLTMTLREEANLPKQAVAALMKKRDKVVKALLKAGLKKIDLSISHTSIYPRYKRSELIGYRASLTLLACIKDISRLAHFVEAAAQARISTLGTSYRSLKVPQNKGKLRTMALEAAKKKAQQIAKVMGVNVGKLYYVKNISQRFGRSSWSNSFSYRRPSTSSGAVQPGAIKMSLSMKVGFFIKD